uniref:Uncharacterized protein n=1 Tax=Physcomitrium patens TaxID=3218 RepID=A0A2K1KK70_PHYPA|nr:hypothetical protein PHYPA_007861 [Physcomitrium patens]
MGHRWRLGRTGDDRSADIFLPSPRSSMHGESSLKRTSPDCLMCWSNTVFWNAICCSV